MQRINFYNELPEKSEATPAATGSLTVLQDPLNQKKRKRRAQRNNPEVPWLKIVSVTFAGHASKAQNDV